MKKVISLLLACVMLFGMAVPAFAAEESEAADYDGYSVIVVRGIDFGGLTYEDGSLALNVDIGAIFTSNTSSEKKAIDLMWKYAIFHSH